MLLVPVDKDVRHLDASYDGGNTSRKQTGRTSARSDDTQGDALPAVFALRPSASLQEIVVDDDEDEDETEAKGVKLSDESVASVSEELEVSERDCEDCAGPNATRFEGEMAAQGTPNRQAQDILQPPSTAGSPDERMLQPTRGTWDITMILRECSVPGKLYLFPDTLMFRSDPDASEKGRGPFLCPGTRYHGRTWRWRLERLTQVWYNSQHSPGARSCATCVVLTAQHKLASSQTACFLDTVGSACNLGHVM